MTPMRAHGAMALPTQAGTIMPMGLAHGQRPDQLTGPFPASLQALMWGRLHGGHPSEKSPVLGSHMVAVSLGVGITGQLLGKVPRVALPYGRPYVGGSRSGSIRGGGLSGQKMTGGRRWETCWGMSWE